MPQQIAPHMQQMSARQRPGLHRVPPDAFLECGILAHGLPRLRCRERGHDKLLAFSCKRRGLCPSCGARRMSQTASHPVGHVIPHVPVRQWVLSLPIPLRRLSGVRPRDMGHGFALATNARGWLDPPLPPLLKGKPSSSRPQPPSMDHVLHLACLVCGRVHAPAEVAYVCPDHGNEGILDVRYDYELIGKRISRATLAGDPDPTIWRYKPLLPVEPEAAVPPLTVGGTPLYEAPRLAATVGLRKLWVKDEARQPSASFKDRASAIAVVRARAQGAEVITTASTGNAAAALAGLCASVAQENVIFVPAAAPPAKVAQLLAYGSRVVLVEGSYDQAFELCLAAAAEYGWYNRNTGYNPYMTEGKKTASYEICEQLGWDAPDAVFVGVGDGCIIGGLHKGLRDLLALGWIDHIPRLYGVQALGSSFLLQAWQSGEDVLTKAPAPAETVADSISAGLPRDRLKAMAAVRDTGGAFIGVSDDEILAAIPALARGSGVFAEPAAAAAWAGCVRAAERGLVGADERVVVVSTGSGLKDIANVRKAVAAVGPDPLTVKPDIDALRAALAAR